MAEKDFYAGMTEDTLERIKRTQFYAELALERGDIAIQDKVGEITIKVRVAKKDKSNGIIK